MSVYIDRDSACLTRSRHCWHDSGITLTSYPGYSVEHCCYCGQRSTVPIPERTHGTFGHGPHIAGPTLSVRRDGGTDG